jgi:hypothetical protein
MARRHQIVTLLLLSAGCAPTSIQALTDAAGYPLAGNVMAKGTKPRPRPSPRPEGGSPTPPQVASDPGAGSPEGSA